MTTEERPWTVGDLIYELHNHPGDAKVLLCASGFVPLTPWTDKFLVEGDATHVRLKGELT